LVDLFLPCIGISDNVFLASWDLAVNVQTKKFVETWMQISDTQFCFYTKTLDFSCIGMCKKWHGRIKHNLDNQQDKKKQVRQKMSQDLKFICTVFILCYS